MLWVKALHIVFMVSWFAGLFYLPRLFVYHSMSDDPRQNETFLIMERKLMIMTNITGTLAVVFGVILLVVWLPAYISQTWMQLKLAGVAYLIFHHFWCIRLVRDFRLNQSKHNHKWYRVFNEVPVLFLFAITILVVVRPF